jgi:hypothetical protein
MNALANFAFVFGWYAGVAAYAMRRGGAAALADVFA